MLKDEKNQHILRDPPSAKNNWRLPIEGVKEHGTRHGYELGCRCDPCTDAKSAAAKQYRIKREEGKLGKGRVGIREAPSEKNNWRKPIELTGPHAHRKHGQYGTYASAGCRCDPCTDAMAAYQRTNHAAKKTRKKSHNQETENAVMATTEATKIAHALLKKEYDAQIERHLKAHKRVQNLSRGGTDSASIFEFREEAQYELGVADGIYSALSVFAAILGEPEIEKKVFLAPTATEVPTTTL